MNVVSRFNTARAARKDAALGVDAKERRMTADLGLSPAEIDRNTYEYRRAVQEATDTSRLEELRDEARRAEDLRVLVGSPFLFTLGLVVCWAVEFAGAILILKSLGIPAAHRVLPALALTAALIGLTHVTVRATAPRPRPVSAPTPGPDGEAGAPESDVTPQREPLDWRRFLCPLAFGVLVVAIAAARVLGSNAEDLSPGGAWSEAIVMIAVSVGPAFAAAWLEARRAPTVELARRLGALRARIRLEERRLRRADAHLLAVDRRAAQWTQENARRRALYATEHELTVAEQRLRADEDASTPNDDDAP